jgi:hypothetical protein
MTAKAFPFILAFFFINKKENRFLEGIRPKVLQISKEFSRLPNPLGVLGTKKGGRWSVECHFLTVFSDGR